MKKYIIALHTVILFPTAYSQHPPPAVTEAFIQQFIAILEDLLQRLQQSHANAPRRLQWHAALDIPFSTLLEQTLAKNKALWLKIKSLLMSQLLEIPTARITSVPKSYYHGQPI